MSIEIYLLAEFIVNYLTSIILTSMTLVLGRRIYNEKRETGKYNSIRCIIFGVYASMSWLLIIEVIYKNTPLTAVLSRELWISTDTLSLNYFGVGLAITFLLLMVAYANGLESLYFTPIFIYGGMIVLFLLTGFTALLDPYIFIGAILSIIFLYYTAFKLKDNSALGLAIMATCAIVGLAALRLFGESFIYLTFNALYPIFGVLYVMGRFNPFKDKGVIQNE